MQVRCTAASWCPAQIGRHRCLLKCTVSIKTYFLVVHFIMYIMAKTEKEIAYISILRVLERIFLINRILYFFEINIFQMFLIFSNIF